MTGVTGVTGMSGFHRLVCGHGFSRINFQEGKKSNFSFWKNS